ncbi:MAG: DUF4251 domain-containing protein [Roseivirga sp.]
MFNLNEKVMRKYMLMMMAVMLVMTIAIAQEEKTVEKLEGKELRKQRKKDRLALFELQKQEGSSLMEDRDFVLQAERIGGKNSIPINVASQINFIRIDGDDLIVQYGLNTGTGRNGLGGVTYEGKIRRFDTKDLGEGKTYNTRIQFFTPYLNGVATINIRIRGNQAQASVWSNGQVLNFEGFYASNENSTIAQSQTLGSFF